MTSKLNLVIGASENPARYSYMAIQSLLQHQYDVVAVSNKSGKVDSVTWDTSIQSEWIGNVDTITLYVNPTNQIPYYDAILNIKPRRVIFNPGTENPDLIAKLQAGGIEPIMACTLVMLSIGTY